MRIHYFRPESLDPKTLEELWNFYSQYAQFVNKDVWQKFLFESDQIVTIQGKDHSIKGCGTITQHIAHWKKRHYGLIYTGITAYHPELRGKRYTQRIGFQSFLKFKLKHPFTPAYWLFFASTYKSYLLMSRNFSTFWPSQKENFPERENFLIRDIMEKRFHQDWNPETGIIPGHGQLCFYEEPHNSSTSQANTDIDFFHKKKLDIKQGDAVVCIAPLSLSNWIKIMLRYLRSMIF